MKRITALLIFFAFAFASIAGAEPHAFKSYKLDAPMAEYIADRKFRCEPGPLPLADHQCATFGETIADRNVKRLDLTSTMSDSP